jgi:hypothetical protein
MTAKTMTIEAPEGYEIDKENSTFEKIVFKEKRGLPMSWQEATKDNKGLTAFETKNGIEYTWGNVPSEYKALRKLELLRDAWNGDWKADWTDSYQLKHSIMHSNNGARCTTYSNTNCLLHFKTGELRDLFAKTFKDLIEEAKPLL